MIEIKGDDPEPLSITVDADQCRWRIRGTLTGPNSQPLAGIEVLARGDHGQASASTEIDGSFEVAASRPGSCKISAELGGCRIDWPGVDPPAENLDPAEIQPVDRDVTGSHFRILDDPCLRLAGRLLGANGEGIEDAFVYVRADGLRVKSRTDSTGAFHFALSEPGDYRMYAFLDGCWLHYASDGVKASWNDLTPISISTLDVRDRVLQLARDMCTLRISGRLLNAACTPRSGLYVATSDVGRHGGNSPSADGACAFPVPAAGARRLSVTNDGCQIYCAVNSSTGEENRARSIRVARLDITAVEFQLPAPPSSACE
ncbi:MAG: carboxypeptidase-like regulatory domain-containing protein [Chloroflexi bacterium]|nr:carboxypeptidase-like regulatory domain-containing protein [Chloroflexota bacterium]